MRYVGQGHEISVELPAGPYDETDAAEFRSRFEQAYLRLYGRSIDGVEIEVLSWTLTIAAAGPGGEAPATADLAAQDTAESPRGRQPLFDPAGRQTVDAQVWLRDELRAGDRVEGPALITEAQTTTVVAPGWRATIDPNGHIVLEQNP
jgi:N-methylhydantoinase A